MSIHPEYADAILAGTKRVEFRKRRLAPDVATVVIYATLPVGRVIGAFEVVGHDVAPPDELWDRHSQHAGIHQDGYRDYYADTAAAVGIIIGDVQRLPRPRLVTDLPGVKRPPQSFSYLTADQATDIRAWLQQAPHGTAGRDDQYLPCAVASIVARTTEAVRATANRLLQAV